MIVTFVILLAGAVSAGLYLWRRKWIDALLVVVAGIALAGLTAQIPIPWEAAPAVTIDSSDIAPVVGQAELIRLRGDGLRASQWHDLPARHLEWTPPSDAVLRLDFPHTVTVGRTLRLGATMPNGAARRLQLLAENGQVIAESTGSGPSMSVEWIAPVAETLLLKARLLDAKGKSIAEGPVPIVVHDAAPLKVQGRFGSPSFDARALNEVLAKSKALIDWQVTLGKTVTRSETPRDAISKPDLIVTDAAYVEKLSAPARAALLAQVAAGAPLLVLAGNASEPALWSRTLQLTLKEQADAKPAGSPLALVSAPFNPATGGAWRMVADRIWSRQWEQGRVVWVGVTEWHRYAISEPQALGVWWQNVLDRAGVRRTEDIAFLAPEEMPLPGYRTEVCALGVSGEVVFPGLKQKLIWQRRTDKADASCVAVWPQQSGWLQMQTGGVNAQMYVYGPKDWPMWQKAQRRDATARYAARTPVAIGKSTVPMASWPFALAFALAMLGLWWRERR